MNHSQRIKNIMDKFGCDCDDAEKVIELRDEGYSICQATMMAGVTDPSYWNKESQSQSQSQESNSNSNSNSEE